MRTIRGRASRNRSLPSFLLSLVQVSGFFLSGFLSASPRTHRGSKAPVRAPPPPLLRVREWPRAFRIPGLQQLLRVSGQLAEVREQRARKIVPWAGDRFAHFRMRGVRRFAACSFAHVGALGKFCSTALRDSHQATAAPRPTRIRARCCARHRRGGSPRAAHRMCTSRSPRGSSRRFAIRGKNPA